MGKEYVKAVFCHPGYIAYMQSASCEMLGWIKHKLQSRFLGEISLTSVVQMTPPLWQKEKGTKEALDERGECKSWLKTQIQKTKIMASGPITSWQIDGETVKTARGFIFLGSKITMDSDCNHEIKDTCFLEEKL